MIVGIGVDITSHKRFEHFLYNSRKIARILSEEEYACYLEFESTKRKLEYLSSRFSVKESFIKATNSYKLKANYSEISVLNNKDGSPYIKLAFTFNDKIHVSLSHNEEYSISEVIIEK